VLRFRLIFGTILAAAIIALLLADGWLSERTPLDWRIGPLGVNAGAWLYHGALSTAVILTFTLLVVRELLGLARRQGYRPYAGVATFFGGALAVGPYISFNLQPGGAWYDESWGMMWLAVATAAAFTVQAVRRRSENALVNLATTTFIIFYAGGLAGFLTKLRMEVGGWGGIVLVLLSMLVVKMTDTGAYFSGRLFGRHKLIEWLSPKKTWEGLVGGLIVAAGVALGAGAYVQHVSPGLLPLGAGNYVWGLVAFGLLMGLVAAAGDLCASLLKRDAAVKDSGPGLPGMGGVLDMFDSPLLAAPAAWFFWTRIVPALG